MIDISTYLNRITSEHKVQPKFMGLVEARLKPFIDLFECLEEINESFDLDTAVGNQLDIIGEYIGVKRLLNFQPEYADAVLSDPYYRMLLKARISLNNWDGSIEGIRKIWGDVFPEYEIQIVDNQDMTMEARIIGLRSLFEGELVQHGYFTPKPIGVRVDYTVVMSITVNTELFLAALNTSRVGTKDLPPPKPPADNSKPAGELFSAGIFAVTSGNKEIVGKPPPETVNVPAAGMYTAGFPTFAVRKSMCNTVQPMDKEQVSRMGKYSLSAKLSTVVRNSTIKSQLVKP